MENNEFQWKIPLNEPPRSTRPSRLYLEWNKFVEELDYITKNLDYITKHD